MVAAIVAGACLVAPWAAVHAARRVRAVDAVGPVVVCYLVGIALSVVLDIGSGTAAAETAGLLQTATVALAIPLLLVGTDLRAWLRLARPTIASFAIAVAAVVVATVVLTPLFDLPAGTSAAAGMTTAVYSGGTANLAAVGSALDVSESAFVAIATADVVVGGLHLLLLLTAARPLLARVLPAPPAVHAGQVETDDPGTVLPRPRDAATALMLGLAIVVVAAALTAAALAGVVVDEPVLDSQGFATGVILVITTFGLALSRVRRLRQRPGTYATGQYLFLVFAVAIGTLVDLGSLVGSLTQVVPYLAAVLAVVVAVHVLAARVVGLDHDTVIITSTAAVFGPPFVGPVAAALRNPDVVPSGMTTGVVGLAVGNYLGLAVAALLR